MKGYVVRPQYVEYLLVDRKEFPIVLDRLLPNMESTHGSPCKYESLLRGWFREKVDDSAMNQRREDAFE